MSVEHKKGVTFEISSEKQKGRFNYQESAVKLLAENLPDQPGTFNLREATFLITQTARELGIRMSENFYGTLTVWKTLALHKAILENNHWILSSTSIATREKQSRQNLTIEDLKSILVCLPEFYQKEIPLTTQYRQAKENLETWREGNVNLDRVAEELLGSSSWRKRRILENLIRQEILSFEDYPLLFANTIGIPPDLYQQKLKPLWQEELEKQREIKREKLSPRRKIQLMKKGKTGFPLGIFLKELFHLEKRSKKTRLAAFYLRKTLEPYGVKIVVARLTRGVYNCFIEGSEAKKLKEYFQNPPDEIREIFKKTKNILQSGFQSFEEYQEYCPPEDLEILTKEETVGKAA